MNYIPTRKRFPTAGNPTDERDEREEMNRSSGHIDEEEEVQLDR
jgi:hypothetical protein